MSQGPTPVRTERTRLGFEEHSADTIINLLLFPADFRTEAVYCGDALCRGDLGEDILACAEMDVEGDAFGSQSLAQVLDGLKEKPGS